MSVLRSMSATRPVGAVIGLVVISVAVASVGPRPAPLPATEPPIDPRVANRVTSFASDHPEFAVLRDGRKDASQIALNHARHLGYNADGAIDPDLQKQMRSAVEKWKGVGRDLTCVDCHEPESDGRYMKAVRFEQHCAGCHAGDLGSIEIAPGLVSAAPTPHGDAALAAAIIDAQAMEWIARESKRPAPEAKPDESKPADQGASSRRPRRGGGSASDDAKTPARTGVASEADIPAFLGARRQEALKKIEVSCGKCHATEKAQTPGDPFIVKNAVIPDQWMTRSVFSHAAHEMVSCTSCHRVDRSTRTSDINMPGIAGCRECHSPGAVGGTGGRSMTNGAGDSCVMCHVYHPKNLEPRQGTLHPADLLRE